MPSTAINCTPGGALYAVQMCRIILALWRAVFSYVSEKSSVQAVKWLMRHHTVLTATHRWLRLLPSCKASPSFWPMLICCPTEGRRLSGLRWLVKMLKCWSHSVKKFTESTSVHSACVCPCNIYADYCRRCDPSGLEMDQLTSWNRWMQKFLLISLTLGRHLFLWVKQCACWLSCGLKLSAGELIPTRKHHLLALSFFDPPIDLNCERDFYAISFISSVPVPRLISWMS